MAKKEPRPSLMSVVEGIKSKVVGEKEKVVKNEHEEIDTALENLAKLENLLLTADTDPSSWELWITTLSDSLGEAIPAETAEALHELKEKFDDLQASEAEMARTIEKFGKDDKVTSTPEYKAALQEFDGLRAEISKAVVNLKVTVKKSALAMIDSLKRNKLAKKELTADELAEWRAKFQEVKMPKDYPSYAEALKAKFIARRNAPVDRDYFVNTFGQPNPENNSNHHDGDGRKERKEVIDSLYERQPAVREFIWNEYFDFVTKAIEEKYPGKKGEQEKKLILDIFFGGGNLGSPMSREDNGLLSVNSKLEEGLDPDLIRELLAKYAETRVLSNLGPQVYPNMSEFNYCIDFKVALAGWPAKDKEKPIQVVPWDTREENRHTFASKPEEAAAFMARQKAYDEKRIAMMASDPEFLNRITAILTFEMAGKEKEMEAHGNVRGVNPVRLLSPFRVNQTYGGEGTIRGDLNVAWTNEDIFYSKKDQAKGAKALTREEAEEKNRIFMQGLSDIFNRGKGTESQKVLTDGDFVRVANERVAAAQEVALSAKRELGGVKGEAGGIRGELARAKEANTFYEERLGRLEKELSDAKIAVKTANGIITTMAGDERRLKETVQTKDAEIARLNEDLTAAKKAKGARDKEWMGADKKLKNALAELEKAGTWNKSDVIAAAKKILEAKE